jgi:hypothetical protein
VTQSSLKKSFIPIPQVIPEAIGAILNHTTDDLSVSVLVAGFFGLFQCFPQEVGNFENARSFLRFISITKLDDLNQLAFSETSCFVPWVNKSSLPFFHPLLKKEKNLN